MVSLEITVVTSLLGSALGSTTIAESLVQLIKEKFDKKSTEEIAVSEIASADGTKGKLAREQEVEITAAAALEALDETYQSTSGIVAERMRQAKLAFNAALSLMIIGVLIIFVGIGLLWAKEGFESGLITVAVGAVSEVVSLLVFKFNKETNNRLDDLRKDLSVIEVARVGLSIAKQIEDRDKRDHAISELSLRLKNS
ncbi:TRADD-N-associated membrane domain-containing protein [Vibrio atlanticus]|uniref:TRADD-N-associated membrane domain-containing protein n=1 Tax=Vibrio atlanticus TaxID=693153 RepID=UPI00354CB999